MGSNLTIGYTYYNQIEAFNYLKKCYKNLNCNFIICDDGSQINPLTENDMPDNWSLLRIEEDIGFNNEGARNLIAKNVNTDWMLLIDLDYILSEDSIEYLNRGISNLKQNVFYVMFRETAGPRPVNNNQFLVYTKYFNKLGGYPITGEWGIDKLSVDRHLLNKVKLEPNYNLFLERSKYKGEGSEYLTK